MAKSGLGRGLDMSFEGEGIAALLGEDTAASIRSLTVPIAKVEPRAGQPRTAFDETALYELASSIEEHGIIQPVTVRDMGGYYQIIAGERRWRAAKLAGLNEIPINIIEADEKKASELALVENLQREDLNPMEEARGYRALMDEYSLTQEGVSKSVGKSRPVVANALRLLNLPEDVQGLVENKSLSLSHARALLELKTLGDMSAAGQYAAEKNISVRELTKLIKRLNAGETVKKPAEAHPTASDGVDYFREVEKELTSRLGRRVKITVGGKKGKFELDFYDLDDFEELNRALRAIGEKGEAK